VIVESHAVLGGVDDRDCLESGEPCELDRQVGGC
jgi:hypothetical protein